MVTSKNVNTPWGEEQSKNLYLKEKLNIENHVLRKVSIFHSLQLLCSQLGILLFLLLLKIQLVSR
jgi:hypothetical protein